MYQASSEQHRKIVSAIVRSGVKPPKSLRNVDWPRFLQAYYTNVDAADLALREPAELAGAALSHLMFARRRRRKSASSARRCSDPLGGTSTTRINPSLVPGSE